MMTKLAWLVLSKSNHDSFCVKALKAKYRMGKNWLQARPAKIVSFSWRGLEGVCSILKKGACKLVG